MTTAAERFAELRDGARRYDDIPTEVVEAAKLHVLDALGCGLAAQRARHRGRGPHGDGRAGRRASGVGDRPRRRHFPAANAAFANAMLCHGLDFDDTHSDSVAHVSTVVVPAAAARRRGATASTGASC